MNAHPVSQMSVQVDQSWQQGRGSQINYFSPGGHLSGRAYRRYLFTFDSDGGGTNRLSTASINQPGRFKDNHPCSC
jgi:hypothetical protein